MKSEIKRFRVFMIMVIGGIGMGWSMFMCVSAGWLWLPLYILFGSITFLGAFEYDSN